jgi:hypothetical protein
MLIEHGKVITIDETDTVIRKYLGTDTAADDPEESKPVHVTEVKVRGRAGEQTTFDSGQTAWVDIEITARTYIEKLAVVIWLRDETEYEIFNTSTERLGFAPITLQPGQSYRCTFELTLNLAHGTFGLCAAVHRYDIGKSYDRRIPAATLFVGSSMGVRGAVNCFPRVIENRVLEIGTENAAIR